MANVNNTFLLLRLAALSYGAGLLLDKQHWEGNDLGKKEFPPEKNNTVLK